MEKKKLFREEKIKCIKLKKKFNEKKNVLE